MNRSGAAELIAFSLILLFGYTAFSKLLNITMFEAVLSNAPVISSGAAVLSWLVPLSELVIVLLLLFARTRRFGFRASIVLLSLFVTYLVVMLATHSALPCSCGGVIGSLGWKQHVALNFFFMGLSVWGMRTLKKAGKKLIVSSHAEP